MAEEALHILRTVLHLCSWVSISNVNNVVMRLITKVITTNCSLTTEIQESTYVFTLLVSLMKILRAQRIKWKWP